MRPQVSTVRASDGPLRRARLLELLPLRQPAERGRAPEAGDGGARLARDPVRAAGGRAGGRRARDGPRRLRRPSSPRRSRRGRRSSSSARRSRAIPADGYVVLATGPLTSPALDAAIGELLGTERPLLLRLDRADRRRATSLDFSKMYALSRYGKGEGADYWNCPLDRGSSTRSSSRTCSPPRPCRSRTSRRASTSRAACRSR